MTALFLCEIFTEKKDFLIWRRVFLTEIIGGTASSCHNVLIAIQHSRRTSAKFCGCGIHIQQRETSPFSLLILTIQRDRETRNTICGICGARSDLKACNKYKQKQKARSHAGSSLEKVSTTPCRPSVICLVLEAT